MSSLDVELQQVEHDINHLESLDSTFGLQNLYAQNLNFLYDKHASLINKNSI